MMVPYILYTHTRGTRVPVFEFEFECTTNTGVPGTTYY
jgi:hypothetical protein